MGTAYTPGLVVSPMTKIRITRRLPLKGTVLVDVGDKVEPDTIVARAEIPGIMQTVRVSEILGLEPSEVQPHLLVKVGDSVERNQVLAESRSFFGLFRSECRSPIDGTVEVFSEVTGHLGIRQKPSPVEINAYVEGRITEVLADEGVVIETEGAFIQGIFGVGGGNTGTIRVLVSGPDQPLEEGMIGEDCRGSIIIGGSNVSGGALRKAAAVGAAGVVAGAVIDSDLVDFLGYDIGVAITGHEEINTTLVITEGFGVIKMAERTFKLLKSLDGRRASINGATQIRAGVIRPEVIVPLPEGSAATREPAAQVLEIGSQIRVIRDPYFGLLGTVTALPPEPVLIPSGSTVRVLEARLEDGRSVSVPRANVEIIEGMA